MREVEIRGKEAVVDYQALHPKVLVVAKANPLLGDWAAYIGAVPGEDHSKEWQDVYDQGAKLRPDLAALLFPNFAAKYDWRK